MGTAEEKQQELDLNGQAILGYVSRWVNQGVGCSKVPDLNGVGLMEDRATLRIASQLIANWLHHDIVSMDQVKQTMQPMADSLSSSVAYEAAMALIERGVREPNGYTEPTLTEFRRKVKATGPYTS